MRDILDPADIWVGTPFGAQVFGNKRPIAVDDAITVDKDGGPVTVDVLANDFDPEGATLTLVSAAAALGTAVAEADNTVTYTPPAGLSGADTVIYEIADDLDQRRTGQITVTIVEPALTITTESDNTLVVRASAGVTDITVTQPSVFAGSYQVDTADLAGGPINLVAPSVSGSVGTGEVLTASGGLWIYDIAAGGPSQTWQWRRSGVDIAGATGASYTVQAGDAGETMTVAEVQTDAFGQRMAISAPLASGGFLPSDDAGLIAWYAADDAATIVESGGVVSSWSDKAGGPALAQALSSRRPQTGTRSLNGLNVLDFGGDDFFERAITLPASGDVAVHMVLEIDLTFSAFEAILAFDAAGNDVQIDAGSDTQFDGRVNATGIGTTTGLTGGPFSGVMLLSAIFDRSGAAEVEIFIDNVSRATMAYTAPLDTAQAMHVMTNRTQNVSVNGAVAELVVTGNLSNRAIIHAYLASKWGLA